MHQERQQPRRDESLELEVIPPHSHQQLGPIQKCIANFRSSGLGRVESELAGLGVGGVHEGWVVRDFLGLEVV